MRAWGSALVLVAAGLLVAAPVYWTQRDSGQAPFERAAVATPQPLHETNRPPEPEPTEAADLTHRQSVLDRFACADCHGVTHGWIMPQDHETMPENECRDCHQPVPEPSPIGLHEKMGAADAGQDDCGLCHAGFADSPGRAPTQPRLCVKCHAEDVESVLPASHAQRSDAVSTCAVCHQRQAVDIPTVPHRIEGWEECSFCHGPQRFTPLEGAHTFRASEDCLSCHDVVTVPGVYSAMHAQSLTAEGCTSCHAAAEMAPLPPSHERRNEFTCGVCHQPADEDVPLVPHSLDLQGACRSCHDDGRLGQLPYDHREHADPTCAACHAEVPGGVPAIPFRFHGEGACTDCHVQSPPALDRHPAE